MKTLLCGLFLVCAAASQATPVTYVFHATVGNVQGPAEPNFGGLGIGSQLTGTFSYDTTAINQGNAASVAYYMTGMSIQVGALSYTLPAPYIEIDLANEYYWAAGGQSANPDYSFGIAFVDTTLPYVQTDTLLRPPPDLMNVDGHYGSLTFYHGNESSNSHLYFNIDRVVERPSSVPEAGSTLGLLAGALGLMTCRGINQRYSATMIDGAWGLSRRPTSSDPARASHGAHS